MAWYAGSKVILGSIELRIGRLFARIFLVIEPAYVTKTPKGLAWWRCPYGTADLGSLVLTGSVIGYQVLPASR